MRCLLVAVFVTAVAVATGVQADDRAIACAAGMIESVCPDTKPVCCAWPNGIIAACCPADSSCDLANGMCTMIPRGSNITNPPTHREDGVNLDVGAAAGILAFTLLGLFAALLASFVLGYKVHLVLERWRKERLERERIALLARRATEDAEDDAEDEADIDDEDEGLCKICYSQLANCVILECGHVCCCFNCGKKLKQCPICRKPVKKLVRTKVRAFSQTGRIPMSARSSEMNSVVSVDKEESRGDEKNEGEEVVLTTISTPTPSPPSSTPSPSPAPSATSVAPQPEADSQQQERNEEASPYIPISASAYASGESRTEEEQESGTTSATVSVPPPESGSE